MPSSAHRPVKILAIDDEPVIRDSIAAYLEDSGFNVLQAGDGQQGLTLFREHTPDLVLLDLRMPEMDGLAFLEALRQEGADTPVIVVSGTGMLQDAIEALRAGAHDFVTKPILDMAVLEHAIQNALERARLRQENTRYRQHLEEEIARRTADLTERTQELEKSNRKLQKEIGQRRQAEATLRRREEKFRELADLLPNRFLKPTRTNAFLSSTATAAKSWPAAIRPDRSDVRPGYLRHRNARPGIRGHPPDYGGQGAGGIRSRRPPQRSDPFPAMVYASPIIRSGALIGMRGILFDLTAIRKAEAPCGPVKPSCARKTCACDRL